MKLFTKIISAALLTAATLSFGNVVAAEHVKVGVVGENNEQWKPIIEKLKQEGVTLELVKFNEYSMPNRALEDKEIYLHDCMTGRFLKIESKEHGYHLTAIGTTLIAPLWIFSKKSNHLMKLKQAIPLPFLQIPSPQDEL